MQVTPGIVARAYRVVIDDGYLESGVGQGTYVKQLRASVLPPDDAPLYLRSPRLPDVGQVDLIRRGFRDFSEQSGFHDMMAYPTRAETTTLQQAYLNWLKYVPLGRCGPEDVVISHGGNMPVSQSFSFWCPSAMYMPSLLIICHTPGFGIWPLSQMRRLIRLTGIRMGHCRFILKP